MNLKMNIPLSTVARTYNEVQANKHRSIVTHEENRLGADLDTAETVHQLGRDDVDAANILLSLRHNAIYKSVNTELKFSPENQWPISPHTSDEDEFEDEAAAPPAPRAPSPSYIA